MKARLTISRVSSNYKEDEVIVRIKVGKTIHQATLALEKYALAISGMSHVPAEYEQRTVGGTASDENS